MSDPAFRLDGRLVAVTGGASGLGQAAARACAAAGAEVVILDRDATAACAAASGIDGARAKVLDVTDEGAVAAMFRRLSGISVLVNAAGIAIRHAAVDHPLADWDRVQAVNVTGSFLCARAAAAQMIAAGRGGAVVNIASIMGFSGGGIYPNISYQTSKGAVVNMTRALAVEWAGQGIRVNAVAPIWVRTPFVAGLLDQPGVIERMQAMTPMARLAEPEEVARAVLFLASDAASMITGHTLPVDGGFLAQ